MNSISWATNWSGVDFNYFFKLLNDQPIRSGGQTTPFKGKELIESGWNKILWLFATFYFCGPF